MATLIAYRTKHGTAKKAAQILEQHLKDNCTLIDIKKDPLPNLANYSTVIVGGSIHMGHIQSSVKHFLRKNKDTLLKKRVGLYLCHYEVGQRAIEEFELAFNEDIRIHSIAKGMFGGEFNMERMNILYRKIALSMGDDKVPESRFKPKEIAEFAALINA